MKRLGIVLALVVGVALTAAPAQAGTRFVTRFLDMTDHVHPHGVPGSLRNIVETKAKPGDLIVFARPDTTTLTKPLVLPDTLKNVTISGFVGGGRATIAGRIVVEEDAHGVTLTGLVIHGTVRIRRADQVRVSFSAFDPGVIYATRTTRLAISDNTFDDGSIYLFHTYNTEIRLNRIDSKGNETAVRAWNDEGLVVDDNRVLGSLQLHASIVAATDNTVSGALDEGIDVARGVASPLPGVLRAIITGNDVRGSGRAGIRVADIWGRTEISRNTVNGNGVRAGTPAYGIEIAGGAVFHPGDLANYVVSANTVLGNTGGGIHVEDGVKGDPARIERNTIRDNGGPGIMVDAGSSFALLDLELGGNDGPGIDLDPAGVTPNGAAKNANQNLDWPELSYDAARQKLVGRTCPNCRVQIYERETGARKGNPRNGEGVRVLGEVTAAADGSFDYPRAAGAISCADAQALTTTTTLPGSGWATSEFSPDLACPAGETPKPGD